MVISQVIECDWPGCGATIQEPIRQLGFIQEHGWLEFWEQEQYGHLCPTHREHTWPEVRHAHAVAAKRKRATMPTV